MRAGHHSVVLSAMADGIGDLTFASREWVAVAGEALAAAAAKHAEGLADLGRFSLCEVAHNAPAYLHAGASLAWHVHFDGAKVSAHVGELCEEACDSKIEGDHSVMSNLGRISFRGRDPQVVAAARLDFRSCPGGRSMGASPSTRCSALCCGLCMTPWHPVRCPGSCG